MDFRLINLLPIAAAEAGKEEEPGFIGLVFYVLLVLAIIAVLVAYARKGMKERVFKNPFTQAAEQMYLFIEGMCVNIIGPAGRKYIPFIGTLWLVIFIGNSVSLFFAYAPTADLSFNLAMAIIAVAYVQYEGAAGHAKHLRHEGKDPVTSTVGGVFRHVSHFTGPKLGLALIPITILIFCVEIVSELMKNVSLSLRLFGNIHGGHIAVEKLNEITPWFPIGGLLLIVKLLTVIVQALVFTMLTCVYISLVTHHEEEHAEHGEPAHAH
jgi:F-type H+-transporting ATPase subunit a